MRKVEKYIQPTFSATFLGTSYSLNWLFYCSVPAHVDWGDGTSSFVNIVGSNRLILSKTYDTLGPKVITLRCDISKITALKEITGMSLLGTEMVKLRNLDSYDSNGTQFIGDTIHLGYLKTFFYLYFMLPDSKVGGNIKNCAQVSGDYYLNCPGVFFGKLEDIKNDLNSHWRIVLRNGNSTQISGWFPLQTKPRIISISLQNCSLEFNDAYIYSQII